MQGLMRLSKKQESETEIRYQEEKRQQLPEFKEQQDSLYFLFDR
jgi:hypothetical protein